MQVYTFNSVMQLDHNSVSLVTVFFHLAFSLLLTQKKKYYCLILYHLTDQCIFRSLATGKRILLGKFRPTEHWAVHKANI